MPHVGWRWGRSSTLLVSGVGLSPGAVVVVVVVVRLRISRTQLLYHMSHGPIIRHVPSRNGGS